MSPATFLPTIMWCLVLMRGSLAVRQEGKIPWNITELILQGYDKRLRPNFGNSKKPVEVKVDLVIGSVDEISEVNMDFTLTIYLRQYWKDHRLAFKDILDKSVKMMPVDGRMADEMWLPDTYFTNDKDSYLQDITVKNRMVRIMPDGYVVYGLRLSITASCVFELKKFPHDTQDCDLNLESYGYSQKDIRLMWHDTMCVDGFQQVELPQFAITSWHCNHSQVEFSSGNYDRIHMHFTLAREVGFFVFQTYMPCIMVVCMSWVSFWINYESSPGRVALGITTVLTMTTIFTSSRASLPRFSYVKAIDIYLLVCFVFVFASLIEYAIVNFNYWKITHDKNRELKNQQRLAANNSHAPEKKDPEEKVAMRLSSSDLRKCQTSSSPTVLRRKARPVPGMRYSLPGQLSAQGQYQDSPGLSTFNRGFIRTIDPDENLVISNHQQVPMQRVQMKQAAFGVNSSPMPDFVQNRPPPQLGSVPLQQPESQFGKMRKGMAAATDQVSRMWGKVYMPRGGDVIIIDTYSRIFFPIAFVVFNFIYWWHYIMESSEECPEPTPVPE